MPMSIPQEHGSLHAGFMHPLFGLDHMTCHGRGRTVGGALGRQAVLWLVPAAFVGTMAVGGALGMLHMPLPFVEPVILASVVVLGLLVALAVEVPTWAGIVIIGLFALVPRPRPWHRGAGECRRA
jgi:urease accessory protein